MSSMKAFQLPSGIDQVRNEAAYFNHYIKDPRRPMPPIEMQPTAGATGAPGGTSGQPIPPTQSVQPYAQYAPRQPPYTYYQREQGPGAPPNYSYRPGPGAPQGAGYRGGPGGGSNPPGQQGYRPAGQRGAYRPTNIQRPYMGPGPEVPRAGSYVDLDSTHD